MGEKLIRRDQLHQSSTSEESNKPWEVDDPSKLEQPLGATFDSTKVYKDQRHRNRNSYPQRTEQRP